jgi:CBS domain-containing protein
MDVQKILDSKGRSSGVLAIPATATLAEFVRQACERNVGALLVTDEDGKLEGIVSERDILHKCNDGTNFKKTTVGQIMTRNIVVVSPKDDINVVMDLMIKKQVRHLPVVSNEKTVGIITIRDIIRTMREADEEDVRRLVEYLVDMTPKTD